MLNNSLNSTLITLKLTKISNIKHNRISIQNSNSIVSIKEVEMLIELKVISIKCQPIRLIVAAQKILYLIKLMIHQIEPNHKLHNLIKEILART